MEYSCSSDKLTQVSDFFLFWLK